MSDQEDWVTFTQPSFMLVVSNGACTTTLGMLGVFTTRGVAEAALRNGLAPEGAVILPVMIKPIVN